MTFSRRGFLATSGGSASDLRITLAMLGENAGQPWLWNNKASFGTS